MASKKQEPLLSYLNTNFLESDAGRQVRILSEFSVLITQGILSHMLGKLVRRFAAVRYRLMATMILNFLEI